MMRRFLLSFLVITVFIISSPIHAQTLIGIKGGYFGWRPFMKDWGAGMFERIGIGYGFLGGPVIGIPLSDTVSISLTGLFGQQSFHWSLPYDYRVFGGSPVASEGTYIFDETRYDIDTAISFNIMEHVKLFAGYKYQKLDVTMEYTEVRWYTSVKIYYNKIEAEFPSHSLAAGIGLNYIVSDIFFLAGNISVLYGIQSKFDVSFDIIARDGSDTIIESKFDKRSLEYNLWGINAEPSIGAKISSSLIATLGARVQWLQYISKQTEADMSMNEGDKANDYLFGVFVGLMYLL